MLKLKLQYFGHLMQSWLFGKDLDAGRDWRQEVKGTIEDEDEMAGWHHWLDGCEFGWTPGDGDGQGGLACCDSWDRNESGTTERLNWTELNWNYCLVNEDKIPCMYCYTHCPYTSVGDSWTLPGKSGLVSCGVTASFSSVLVHTRFCLCPAIVYLGITIFGILLY